jgi:hypothetical protein
VRRPYFDRATCHLFRGFRRRKIVGFGRPIETRRDGALRQVQCVSAGLPTREEEHCRWYDARGRPRRGGRFHGSLPSRQSMHYKSREISRRCFVQKESGSITNGPECLLRLLQMPGPAVVRAKSDQIPHRNAVRRPAESGHVIRLPHINPPSWKSRNTVSDNAARTSSRRGAAAPALLPMPTSLAILSHFPGVTHAPAKYIHTPIVPWCASCLSRLQRL